MAYVGVNVDESTKEQWQSYVDESDYGSMSEFIRNAVRKEIHDGGYDRLREELQSLEQVNERMISHLEEMEERLNE